MIYLPNLEIIKKERMASSDRILIVRPMAGKKPLSGTGLVDPRLFTGGNQLHAIQDPLTTMWTFKYELGITPPVLKQKWTSFDKGLAFVKNYFKRRNLEIVEIRD